MPIALSQIADFVATTLETWYKRKTWIDISLDWQDFIWAQLYYHQNKDGNEDNEEGGTQCSWHVQVDNIDTARDTAPFDRDRSQVKNLLKKVSVGWTHQTANFSFDEREDDFQGDDATQVLKMIKVREHSMWNSFFKHMERRFWSAPTADVTPARFYGIPWWLQKPSANGGFSFGGGNPSGFSGGRAGLSTLLYPNYANGTFTYNNLTELDFIYKAKEAVVRCQFKAPHSYKALLQGAMPRYGFYTVYEIIGQLELYLKNSNDSLGMDISKYMGKVLFRGVPLNHVPILEDQSIPECYDSRKPFYGIDWRTMGWTFKKGEKMKVGKPIMTPDNHRGFTVNLDNAGQQKCVSLRENFVGCLAT